MSATGIREWLTRHLTFLHKAPNTELKQDADAGAGTERMSFSQAFRWNTRAKDKDKIELLHQQVQLLVQQLDGVRQDVRRVEATLTSSLEEAEARHLDAHEQLTGRLEARERRAARVDAHGIWPIGAGIVLTGIPSELAAHALIGWLAIITGIAVTGWAGHAVITDQDR